MNFRLNIIFLISIAFLSCQHEEREVIKSVDKSLRMPVVRTELLIDSILRKGLLDDLHPLTSDQYPEFFQIYYDQVLQISGDSIGTLKQITQLHSDSSYLRLYKDVLSTFSQFDQHLPAIVQAISQFKEMLGEDNAQHIDLYTFISGFALQSFLFETKKGEGIALGLDMFMGEDFPYATVDPGNPQFSSYLTRTYDPAYMSTKVIDLLLEDRMAPVQKSDFLNLMIWGGKKLYVKDQIIDFLPDSMIIEYTSAQMEWCRKNEREIWNYFFEENLFYESDIRKINKLVSPAPSSPGMPPEAPGQTGTYMGWQIVKEYMRRNPDVSLSQLLGQSDAQFILDQSKYKPLR